MKTCPTCEGQGSVADAFEVTTERERLEASHARHLLAGWAVTLVVLLASFVHGCPYGCVQTPDGRGAPAPAPTPSTPTLMVSR